MGFRINTNIAALSSHTAATMNNRSLDNSLARLSSGLRINTAADDASGMAIADSLRSQANSLGQAISNANDGIGLIQTADKAMDEQLKILDTIKTKAIQAASDTQTTASRQAIQKDVNRLIEQLDNIAKTTSFNGQVLLSGKYSNKEFQVGAFSNQTINASINNTQSLAIGSISTRTDLVQLGNTIDSTQSAAQGSTVISIAAAVTDATGLAKGDVIRIAGVGDYTISSVTSSGDVSLTEGLSKAMSAGADISLVSTADEDLSKIAAIATDSVTSLAVSDLTGFAVGDKITITNSAGSTATTTITGISASQGTISFGALTLTGVAPVISLNTRAVVGSSFETSDYMKYSVEGTELTGVQLTQSQGYGVADTGLGRVADLINEATSLTGIKAVATVEANSLIGVSAGTLASDMKINGVVVMEAGQSILAGDSDNAIVTAINAKSDLTGVTASLEADGTLTLKSDGRAMKLETFTLATGINDGTYAGKLDLTKNGLEVMDVTATHYSDAGLTTAAGSTATTRASSLTEVVTGHKLSELVIGQKDSNGDGLVNNDDAVGLLMTAEGAQLAMDIVEAAIGELDATRADLGSVQNQLTVTVNNISVTQVNVKSAESSIRDVDFAAESANFAKFNILAQSGSYAMSQANAIQQNVLRLLQ
ncbi:MAG: flagellin [Sulfurospirillaceae bacterium]|nr:flagellin [Sulfurospirillaceae bacterium]MDD3462469.1 flagellin [Sulfurospirillaceae bacterium]